MTTISVILTTLFKKRSELRELLENLSSQSKCISEISITFQRSPANNYGKTDIEAFLKGLKQLNIFYEISDELGISRGRNKALKKVKGNWILISDDDCRYPPNAMEKISESAEAHPSADVLTFCSERSRSLKKFRKNIHECSSLSIRRTSSIEIVFNRKILQMLGEKPFDERFGLGSEFETGEEQIFLSDIIKKGGKILFIPKFIVAHEEISSGNLLTYNSIRARGAVFRRIYGNTGLLISVLFIFKKAFEKRLNMGIIKGLILILSGFKEYKARLL